MDNRTINNTKADTNATLMVFTNVREKKTENRMLCRIFAF